VSGIKIRRQSCWLGSTLKKSKDRRRRNREGRLKIKRK